MPCLAEVALVAPREPFASEPTDLSELRLGRAEALAEVYRAHGPRLLRLCARLLGSVPDAEDVLHDVFVALPALLCRYEERGQFGAWLRAVTVRSAQGRLRAGRRREGLASYDVMVERVSAPDRSPWDAVDLSTAIDAMPDTLRAVFVLKQLEGYSHDEIAGLLGISAGASRVRLLRALQHLRLHLEPPAR